MRNQKKNIENIYDKIGWFCILEAIIIIPIGFTMLISRSLIDIYTYTHSSHTSIYIWRFYEEEMSKGSLDGGIVLHSILWYDRKTEKIDDRKKLLNSSVVWKAQNKIYKKLFLWTYVYLCIIFCCFYKTHNSLRSVWISVCDVINNNLKTSFHPVLYNFYEVHVWMFFFVPPFFLLNIYTGYTHTNIF